jgi:hypothetical protein
MPSRLDDLMRQIRDPSRWPPVPERPLDCHQPSLTMRQHSGAD